jgi:GT2 family glycosyltransferase
MNSSGRNSAEKGLSSSAATPRVSVIVVTWNKKDYVLQLLASLGNLTYPRECIDILVVDNASGDGTLEAIIEEFPEVRVIRNPENLGGTGGFNTGLRSAFDLPYDSCQYLWLLDNDVLVHRHALSDLVDVLQRHEDIAVAGSTMMQLDYPWRINEMGAFVERSDGALILNRHRQEVIEWKGRSAQQLLDGDGDLGARLMHCRHTMDVDYVAAASMLVRADVARQAGLWKDFFIHLDDVEWCLRIARMGHRVVVSARSLIWHLSAAAKVPTWVAYYDNRNLLELVRLYGPGPQNVQAAVRRVLTRAVYFALIGKSEMATFLHWAVDDFRSRRFGKRELTLSWTQLDNDMALSVLTDPKVRTVLVPWTVNLQATGLQEVFVRAKKARPQLRFDFLTEPGGRRKYQIPEARFVPVPAGRWKRIMRLLRMRGDYDLVLQSDYAPILVLSWIAERILFVNNETFAVLPRAGLADVLRAIKIRLADARFRPEKPNGAAAIDKGGVPR